MSLLAPLDEKFNAEVRHVSPTLEQNGIVVADAPTKTTRDIVYRDTSSCQTSRNIVSPQTNKDVRSCIKIITDVDSGVNKYDSSLVGELFRNRKRHLPNADADDPTTQHIKISQEILGQEDDDFSVLDEEGL